MTRARLLGTLLRDVSRSFYLSIRLLPRRLRAPVGLAYLLARATDTVADTAVVPVAQRAETLRRLDAILQGEASVNEIVDLTKEFAPLQTNESERALLAAVPDAVRMLELSDEADRRDIRGVLTKITRGQMLDLERPILQSAGELDEYTYLVAGCVGEFWTRICSRHLPHFSSRSEEKMIELGTRYGKALQLINILRDLHVDLATGRRYFGFAPNEWPEFEPVYRQWLDEAGRGLDAGMEYVDAIRNGRVRAATALPALIGARTLSILRNAGERVLRERLKVPRAEVRSMIGAVMVTLANRNSLGRIYARYKK